MDTQDFEGLAVQPLTRNFDELPAREDVQIGGVIYWLRDRDDLSMADTEDFRRVMMQVATAREFKGGKDGFLTEAERRQVDAREVRLCKMALLAPPDDATILAWEVRQRNGLIHLFFDRWGIGPAIRKLVEQQAIAQTLASDPTPLRPLRSSSGKTPKPRPDSKITTAAG